MTTTAEMVQTPLIRLAHPLAFAALLKKVGTTTDSLFRRVGLPVYCQDPTAFVPLKQAWALFDAAAQLEDLALGWHVGRFFGDNRLSAGLLQKIEHAPTLYQALYRFVRLVSAEASHLELGILEHPDDIVLHTRYSTIKDWSGYASSQSYQIGVFVDLIRQYVGPEWDPPGIGLECPTVPTVAQEHFPGSQFRLSQKVGYVTIPRSYLHLGPRGGAQSVPDETPVHLAWDFDFIDTLKAVVKAYLEDGYPSASKMASLTDSSARTLFRRLSERGLTYQSLVDEVRFEQATELLQNQDLQITEISRSVGFNDPSHFSRMFRRVGGLNPGEFRASLRA